MRIKQSQPLVVKLFLGLALVLLALILVALGSLVRWQTTGERPPLVSYALPDPEIDETDIKPQEVDNYSVPASHPKYLSIPSIDVTRSRVQSVGVDADNVLGSPLNIHDTAWYNQSATPGSGGAVLIDGHNGGYVRDGVFSRLRDLKPGDDLIITRGDDQQFTYEVVDVATVSLEEANSSGMQAMLKSSKPGTEALNLITCEGTYSRSFRQFDQRIMVRSLLVG